MAIKMGLIEWSHFDASYSPRLGSRSLFGSVILSYFLKYSIFLVWKVVSVYQVGDLSKKTVAISGCDTGFGKLLALKLVKQGVPVIAGCLTEKVSHLSG